MNISLQAYIDENQKIIYRAPDYKERIDEFKAKNISHDIEVSFIDASSGAYFQHKYYRGYLLLAVADAMGERDTDYCHLFLKKKYLYRKMETETATLRDIPAKHRGHALIIMREEIIIGYVPSTADITYKEFNEYILKVENLLFVDLGGCLSADKILQLEAAEARARAFKIPKEKPVITPIMGDEVQTTAFDDCNKIDEEIKK